LGRITQRSTGRQKQVRFLPVGKLLVKGGSYSTRKSFFAFAACKRLAFFLSEKFSDNFEISHFEASKDPFDPLRHDLIVIKNNKNRYRKLDILIANYKWELEGLLSMGSAHSGPNNRLSKIQNHIL
ncbi:hypothetical protein MHK_004316, partial [Candidatus Magnetomorum sp. HK-1]